MHLVEFRVFNSERENRVEEKNSTRVGSNQNFNQGQQLLVEFLVWSARIELNKKNQTGGKLLPTLLEFFFQLDSRVPHQVGFTAHPG